MRTNELRVKMEGDATRRVKTVARNLCRAEEWVVL